MSTPCAAHITGTEGQVKWTRYDITKFLLSQSAALLVLQGLPLLTFFEGVSFSSPDFQLRGTFGLLRAQMSELSNPPLILSNVVLARLHEIPEGCTRDQILGGLLATVL